MENKATILDVAKLANVSTALVSRVINGQPNVSLTKEKAIRAAIADLNYQPLPRGRRRGQRSRKPYSRRLTNRIALLIFGQSSVFASEVYLNTLRGVENALRQHGKRLQIHFIYTEEDFSNNLNIGKVDGIILFNNQSILKDKNIQTLRQYPCVQVMGRKIDEDHWWDHVSYENKRIGELAAQYLLSYNFEHYAIMEDGDDKERGASFKQKIIEAGKSCHHLNLLRFSKTEWESPVQELLSLKPTPQGIFCDGDEVVADLYVRLYEQGKLPGKDFKIIGCNNDLSTIDRLSPRPATIDIHAAAVGEKAVEQLLWRIDNPEPGKIKLALEPELIKPDHRKDISLNGVGSNET